MKANCPFFLTSDDVDVTEEHSTTELTDEVKSDDKADCSSSGGEFIVIVFDFYI